MKTLMATIAVALFCILAISVSAYAGEPAPKYFPGTNDGKTACLDYMKQYQSIINKYGNDVCMGIDTVKAGYRFFTINAGLSDEDNYGFPVYGSGELLTDLKIMDGGDYKEGLYRYIGYSAKGNIIPDVYFPPDRSDENAPEHEFINRNFVFLDSDNKLPADLTSGRSPSDYVIQQYKGFGEGANDEIGVKKQMRFIIDKYLTDKLMNLTDANGNQEFVGADIAPLPVYWGNWICLVASADTKETCFTNVEKYFMAEYATEFASSSISKSQAMAMKKEAKSVLASWICLNKTGIERTECISDPFGPTVIPAFTDKLIKILVWSQPLDLDEFGSIGVATMWHKRTTYWYDSFYFIKNIRDRGDLAIITNERPIEKQWRIDVKYSSTFNWDVKNIEVDYYLSYDRAGKDLVGKKLRRTIWTVNGAVNEIDHWRPVDINNAYVGTMNLDLTDIIKAQGKTSFEQLKEERNLYLHVAMNDDLVEIEGEVTRKPFEPDYNNNRAVFSFLSPAELKVKAGSVDYKKATLEWAHRTPFDKYILKCQGPGLNNYSKTVLMKDYPSSYNGRLIEVPLTNLKHGQNYSCSLASYVGQFFVGPATNASFPTKKPPVADLVIPQESAGYKDASSYWLHKSPLEGYELKCYQKGNLVFSAKRTKAQLSGVVNGKKITQQISDPRIKHNTLTACELLSYYDGSYVGKSQDDFTTKNPPKAILILDKGSVDYKKARLYWKHRVPLDSYLLTCRLGSKPILSIRRFAGPAEGAILDQWVTGLKHSTTYNCELVSYFDGSEIGKDPESVPTKKPPTDLGYKNPVKDSGLVRIKFAGSDEITRQSAAVLNNSRNPLPAPKGPLAKGENLTKYTPYIGEKVGAYLRPNTYDKVSWIDGADCDLSFALIGPSTSFSMMSGDPNDYKGGLKILRLETATGDTYRTYDNMSLKVVTSGLAKKTCTVQGKKINYYVPDSYGITRQILLSQGFDNDKQKVLNDYKKLYIVVQAYEHMVHLENGKIISKPRSNKPIIHKIPFPQLWSKYKSQSDGE